MSRAESYIKAMSDETNQKCGIITILGRPNAGKSTLFNQLLKKHLAPVTHKPQTTRYSIKGILTEGDCQMVFVDTPGIHASHTKGDSKSHSSSLNRMLNRNARNALVDADVALLMASSRSWTEQDEEIYKTVAESNIPCILLLNKIDLLSNKEDLLPLLAELGEAHRFEAMIPVCALRSNVFEKMRSEIIKHLPQRPFLFAEEESNDQDQKLTMAEMIREQATKCCHAELPYVLHVEVESLLKKDKILEVAANIWVDKTSQKAILIGAQGATLKQIGSLARQRIEKLFKTHVYLKLQVKVKKDGMNERLLKDINVS